jgi:hypothetical protein
VAGDRRDEGGIDLSLIKSAREVCWGSRTGVVIQNPGYFGDAAHGAAKQAEAAQRAAQQRLDQSGLRGRRQARTELAAANETVTGTREMLAVARQQASEPLRATEYRPHTARDRPRRIDDPRDPR